MTLSKKHIWLFISSLLLAIALTFTLTWLFLPREVEYVPVAVGAADGVPASYRELYAVLKAYSYYGLAEDAPLDADTARALVAATGDPYAAYFTEEEFAAYSQDLNGSFVGIGVLVHTIVSDGGDASLCLLAVYEGSGAAAAGLRAGDLIVSVDGQTIAELGGASEALEAVRGESGTDVTLGIRRGSDTFTVTVSRAAATKQTVFSGIIAGAESNLAYIRITAFDAVTLRQFISAVQAAEADPTVTGVIFDLRYNGGGYLHIVAQMLAYLLPDGVISHIRYGSELLQQGNYDITAADGTMSGHITPSLTTDEIDHEIDLPMAILVNGSTASAAELFTAALRDYAANDNAHPDFPDVTIVGETTYGKGCMQTTYTLSDGSVLKLTVALYDPPYGENYHDVGIAPSDGYAVTATDRTVADLYLKSEEGATALPSGADDATLLRAIEAFAP